MRVAKIELGVKELDILRAGKPIIIRLPDAQVEISLSKGAILSDRTDNVLGRLQDLIKKARPAA